MLGAQAAIEFARRVEGLAADAVQPLVVPPVQVTGAGTGQPEPLDTHPVPRVGAGPDHVVEAERQRPRERDEGVCVGVHELLDPEASLTGGEHVLQRVVIGAGLEPDRVAKAAVMPGQHVGLDVFERVTKVRPRIDIGNGGREIHSCRCHRNSSKLAAWAPNQRIKIEAREQGLEVKIRTRHWPRERGIISSREDPAGRPPGSALRVDGVITAL